MADRDEAYSAAYPALFAVAYRAAFRITGDRESSSELAQEALIRAYTRWHQLESRCEGWVITTTAHLAIDQWRREQRRPMPHRNGMDEPLDAGAALRLDLVRVLAALPRRQREVAVLRYLEDRAEAEVAEMLGCSRGSVKRHAARARAALRALLDSPAVTPETT